MPISPTARIHPAAIISPEAQIADEVEIGPYAIVEGKVSIGPRTRVLPFAHLIGKLTIGTDNEIGKGVSIGDRPQHATDRGDDTRIEIGSFNVFRENATVHRGSKATGLTKIGDRNYFMVNSHIGHDATVGSDCTFANNCMIAGHCIIEDRVLISGGAGVHQFGRVGRLALLSGQGAATKDMPPFIIVLDRNRVAGLNLIGMRRAGMPREEISAVRAAFKILYRQGLILQLAIEKLEQELGDKPPVAEMIRFIRASKRGVCGSQAYVGDSDAEAA